MHSPGPGSYAGMRRGVTPVKVSLPRVLVLDPHPQTRAQFEQLFAGESVSLVFYERLADAVRALSESAFQCAVVDMELIEMPGHQAVPILKAVDRRVPIVVTAATNSREQEIQVCREDIFFYFIKSFCGSELKLAVAEAVRQSRAAGTSRPGELRKPPRQDDDG